MFEMVMLISKQVDSMNEEQVINWINDIDFMIDNINQQLETVNVHDWHGNVDLISKQDNLQLCLELLNERLDSIIDKQLQDVYNILSIEINESFMFNQSF